MSLQTTDRVLPRNPFCLLVRVCAFPSLRTYAGQDSTIHFVHFDPSGAVSEQRVRYALLPVSSLAFLSEKAVVGGGHDMNPLVFTANSSGQW